MSKNNLAICNECVDQYRKIWQENDTSHCLLCSLMLHFPEIGEITQELGALEYMLKVWMNEMAATFTKNSAQLEDRIAELMDQVDDLEAQACETEHRLNQHFEKINEDTI